MTDDGRVVVLTPQELLELRTQIEGLFKEGAEFKPAWNGPREVYVEQTIRKRLVPTNMELFYHE